MCPCNCFRVCCFRSSCVFFNFLQSTDVARSYNITYDVRDIDSKLCGVIRNDNLTSRKYNGQRPNHDFNSYLQHVRVEKSSLKLQLTIYILIQSLISIYFTTITKKVIQLILIMLVGTDVCVRAVFVWEETGVPRGNPPV